ncbi:putative membrane transporter protein YfcA [bioreactor metagenome]|uniref:Putative membrane transporter protein YfcA n=1 Tax=bioreactor metagenome TaxID=1076179 RepID=A0A644ZNJ7_9ZZZZ|nr:TSUP family transporter [Christensenella sp.]
MTVNYWSLLSICPLVFAASLLDAVAGGGGLISLPAYLIAGLPPHNAIATNKLSSSIGTVASTARFIKNKCVDWPTAIPSALLAVLGSIVGANLILAIDDTIIRYIMLVLVPVLAFVILKKRDLSSEQLEPVSRQRQFIVICLFALIVGMYDGFYGPGTGTFLLLAYTQLAKLPLRLAAGNVKIANLSSNIGSLVVFLLNGQAIIPIGLISAVFAVSGHFIGAGMMLKNGTKIVKPFILTVLGLLFVRLLYDLLLA